MSHYIDRCSCGAVIRQCRCPGPKTETVKVHGCVDCKAAEKPTTNRSTFVQNVPPRGESGS